MSDWNPYVDKIEYSDGGRQMEQMVDNLDRKILARRFAEKLGRVAEALTPSQRKLLVMVVVEQRSSNEIIRLLGITKQTFYERVEVLSKKISNFFRKKPDSPPSFGVISRGPCQTTDCHT